MDPLILTRIFRHGPITYSFQWNIRHHLSFRDTTTGEMVWKHLREVYKGNIPEDYFSQVSGFDRASSYRIKSQPEISKIELSDSLKRKSLIHKIKNHPLVENSKRANDSSHPAVLSTILRRDPSSISIETPVWSTNRRITGHIDLIRFSNSKLEIIDYKPKGDFYSSIPQIATYGLVAKEQFGIPLESINCIAFNSRKAWEFPPTILTHLPETLYLPEQ